MWFYRIHGAGPVLEFDSINLSRSGNICYILYYLISEFQTSTELMVTVSSLGMDYLIGIHVSVLERHELKVCF